MMKYLNLLFFIFLSFSSAKAQYLLSVEVGYSDYIYKSAEYSQLPEEVLSDFINFTPLLSWRVTFDKKFTKKKISGLIGITLYNVGAENFFYDKWKNIFSGIHIGAEYQLKNIYFGLHSYPAIRLDTSTQIASSGGGLDANQRLVYNIDINPSLAYAITEKLMAKLSFSYGLNKALETGEDVDYRINAFRVGLQYELF